MNIPNNSRTALAKRFNLMSEGEREFLISHLKEANPKNIIEIGAYAGGLTHFLYQVTKDTEAKVLSIDINNHYGNYHMPIGFIADGIDDPRLRREYGKDVSEICELFDKTGEKFDFLVLDSAHMHPIESVNFLTILPYLTENATIVLHDISLFAFSDKNLACKLLFDTVVGDKSELIENPHHYFANIGAIRLNTDTRKYIRDVFSMLRFPWIRLPLRFGHILNVIKRHYNEECVKLFQSAFVFNAWKLSKTGGDNLFEKLILNAEAIQNRLAEFDNIIFWGFGKDTFYRELVILFKMMNLPMAHEFWDDKWEVFKASNITIKPQKPKPYSLGTRDCVIATGKNRWDNDGILSNVVKTNGSSFFTLADLANLT